MKSFALKIVTPTRELLNSQVEHVMLPGAEGFFGVLAGHVPLLAILNIGTARFRSPDTERTVFLSGGYAEVLGDGVTVIARSAEFIEEIDVNRAESARIRAADRLAAHAPGTDVKRAQDALLRALLRLEQARKFKRSPGS